MMLNTRPIGLVFKQQPRDLANVNAWKNMCDPYNHSYRIRISFASKRIKTYLSAVDPKLRTGTVSVGSLPLVTLSYLSHSA